MKCNPGEETIGSMVPGVSPEMVPMERLQALAGYYQARGRLIMSLREALIKVDLASSLEEARSVALTAMAEEHAPCAPKCGGFGHLHPEYYELPLPRK